ncbi:hypothetical protein [Undibacterium sp. TS12]|uniref:hypothetical protein n=1 Tax=Undibacterium sp. TS12 TaxID=2908202 RepID=UPI001F4D218C|nr:hypothetical protein [Undibacterium sp. TS12]MCH8621287.1 hypothetical protein [Undibacterium sp. TS12]
MLVSSVDAGFNYTLSAMKISDLVLYVRIWLLMATIWFFAAAIERFSYPFRYDGELRAADVLKLTGDCKGLAGDTMIAWRLSADKKSVEYKCPASKPWPFYSTSSSTDLPPAILRAVTEAKKETGRK